MLFLETPEEIDRPSLVLKVDPPEESLEDTEDTTEDSMNSNSAMQSDCGIYVYKYSKLLRRFIYYSEIHRAITKINIYIL